MDSIFVTHRTADAIPIWFVTAANYTDVRKISAPRPRLCRRRRFRAQSRPPSAAAGQERRQSASAACCSGSRRRRPRPFLPGRLAQHLPDGVYRFANEPHDARLAALAIALGSYRFTRYRKAEARAIKLDLPQSVDREELSTWSKA